MHSIVPKMEVSGFWLGMVVDARPSVDTPRGMLEHA